MTRAETPATNEDAELDVLAPSTLRARAERHLKNMSAKEVAKWRPLVDQIEQLWRQVTEHRQARHFPPPSSGPETLPGSE